jgi:hypothetical protein
MLLIKKKRKEKFGLIHQIRLTRQTRDPCYENLIYGRREKIKRRREKKMEKK